jgi:hypothetical protein
MVMRRGTTVVSTDAHGGGDHRTTGHGAHPTCTTNSMKRKPA